MCNVVNGNAYVAGDTNFQSFPITPGAYDTSFNGSYDGFVLKMGIDLPPSFRADEYLPLFPRTTWKYLKDGEDTVERKVLDKKVKVNGVETSAVRFIQENVTEYLTSDSNGILLHRQSQHSDYRYSAVVNHTALDGTEDDHPFDDVCPRSVIPPYVIDPYPDQTIMDKGCGSKKSDGTFGVDILTDVIVK